MKPYSLYVCDTETTGLDFIKNDVIELSLYRLSDNSQKTWCIKPLNFSNIEADALRINGHKLEDITHKTKYGKETYLDASEVIIEIENWLMEDNVPVNNRVLVGQNISFDKNMLEQLWSKCESRDSFPFGRKSIDTIQIEFFLDFCKGNMSESYSLNNLTKKYGIKNEKAHTAAADVKATKELFDRQVDFFKKTLNTLK
jgi:DNA polymerase III alpha subunit (gram-positive type)